MSFDEIVRCLSEEDQKVVADMLALFADIDRQTETFSLQTGLICRKDCGACCTTADIETTVTEVLPLAVHLWANGTAQSKLEVIRLIPAKGICGFYEPDPVNKIQGRCSIYAYRPGLCRLFGFAARKDKYGKLTLVTCKIIKDSQPQECKRAQEEMQKRVTPAPLLGTYAFSVANIDPGHGQKLFPINQAIRQAIEKVGYSRIKKK